MKLSIRWKLLLFVAGFILLVLSFLAFSIYKTSYNLFYDSFVKNKLNFAETLAKSINGDIHKNLDSLNDMSNPEYLRLQKYFNEIRQNDSAITYLYSINYNPDDDEFYYCLYADYATDNIFWFETDEFAFEIHFDSLNNNYILYQQDLFYDKFTIDLNDYQFEVSVENENDIQSIYIDNQKYAEIISFDPFVCKIDTAYIDADNRYYEKEIMFGDEVLYSYSSTSFIGEPLSNPGDILEETEENIENCRKVFKSGKSYVETSIVESTYGQSISAYGIIKDSSDVPVGLACVDIYEKELTLFRKSISRISFIISGFSIVIVIIVLFVLLEFLVIRKIKKIDTGIRKIAKKELDTQIQISSKDEFENVANGFNSMAKSLKSFYENLEEKVKERTLTIEQQKEELNTQADNLREVNIILNEQNEILQQQKEEISSQKDNLEDAYTKISIQKTEIEKAQYQTKASITYASRIQKAILPKSNILSFEHFIYFNPRDIVSGDFYFFKKSKNYIFAAAADCTGHGVPGAFMSMLGIALLNEIISKTDVFNSAFILDELRMLIKNVLQQSGEEGEQQDGMDIAFCTVNSDTLELSFAGAHNPLWIYRPKNILKNAEFAFDFIEISADHQPVGIYLKEKPFKEQLIQLYKNDILYLFSDGYTSQFGGEINEKYKTLRFKNVFSEIYNLTLVEQKQILEKKFIDWKANHEQTDDVLVVGIKI